MNKLTQGITIPHMTNSDKFYCSLGIIKLASQMDENSGVWDKLKTVVKQYRPFNNNDAAIGGLAAGAVGLGLGALRNKLRPDEEEKEHSMSDKLTYAAALGLPVAMLPQLNGFLSSQLSPYIKAHTKREVHSKLDKDKSSIKLIEDMKRKMVDGIIDTAVTPERLEQSGAKKNISDMISDYRLYKNPQTVHLKD